MTGPAEGPVSNTCFKLDDGLSAGSVSLLFCKHSTQRHDIPQGGHKEQRKKFPELSMVLQGHNYTFPELITTKSIRTGDVI